MIERLARRFVTWQIRHCYLSAEEEKLYQYAFELLIGQAVNLMIACLLAVIFRAYIPVFVFLLAFIPLRSYAGGHHADSFNVCTMVSALILLSVCLLSRITFSEKMILTMGMVFAAVCGVLICFLAPLEDQNKPLDQSERLRYGRWSRYIWGLEAAAWFICYHRQIRQASLGIMSAHLAVAGLLLAGVIKRKRIMNRRIS